MKISVKKILSFVMTVAIVILSLSMVVFADTGATDGGTATDAASTAGTSAGGGSTSQAWLMIVIYIAFFAVIGYFLIYRPNKKRKKQEEELRSSIILGDEVTTIGGIVGRVVNIKDDNITIETSLDKTLMEFKNWAIREVKKPISDDEPESSK